MGDDIFCRGYQPATISTNPGFNNYEWYKIGGTFEIIQAVTGMNNSWTGPFSPGQYLAKGYVSAPDACPAVSPLWTVVDEECLDIEVTKTICNIPIIPELGDTVTYCIEICNINSVTDGLIYTAENLIVEDTWPNGVTFLGYTATKGTYIPTMPNGTWAIPDMNSGDCETLEIMGRIDRDGVIENLVQLNQVDKTDIDSAPNNEDGDQSEDEEALASFSVILASIGDQVWIDADMDGIFDPGETGVENVQIILYNIDGTPRDTAYTNSSGIYEFINVPTGDYYLEFYQTTSTTPDAEDYPFTITAQGDGQTIVRPMRLD